MTPDSEDAVIRFDAFQWRFSQHNELAISPFGRSRVRFAMDRSVLKRLPTRTRSSPGFVKYPELGAAQRNG
jgi:hypothetical protein